MLTDHSQIVEIQIYFSLEYLFMNNSGFKLYALKSTKKCPARGGVRIACLVIFKPLDTLGLK